MTGVPLGLLRPQHPLLTWILRHLEHTFHAQYFLRVKLFVNIKIRTHRQLCRPWRSSILNSPGGLDDDGTKRAEPSFSQWQNLTNAAMLSLGGQKTTHQTSSGTADSNQVIYRLYSGPESLISSLLPPELRPR